MKKRKTVTIDEDIMKKLRELQAKKIKKTGKAVSFTEIVNELLRKEIK